MIICTLIQLFQLIMTTNLWTIASNIPYFIHLETKMQKSSIIFPQITQKVRSRTQIQGGSRIPKSISFSTLTSPRLCCHLQASNWKPKKIQIFHLVIKLHSVATTCPTCVLSPLSPEKLFFPGDFLGPLVLFCAS